MTRTIFENATLFDGIEAPKPNSYVVVEGDRIAAVGHGRVSSADGDQRFDLRGKTIMPGMVQCHFHTGFGPDAGNPMPILGLNMPPAYLGMIAMRNAQIALDNGVTSIIGSSNGDHLDLALRDAIKLGVTRGPRVIACTTEMGPSGDYSDGNNRSWFMRLGNTGLIRSLNGVEEFRRAVREEVGRGCEIVKISLGKGHGASPSDERCSLTKAEVEVVVETAHAMGALVRAHCPSRAGVILCAKAGIDIIDHADRIDDEGIEAVLKADATVVPSLLWSHRFLTLADNWDYATGDFPIGDGFPESPQETQTRLRCVREDYEYTCSMLPRMQAAGVRLVLGDDYGFPMMPHGDYVSEMEVTAATGISHLDLMRWATRNGAAAMKHKGTELGTLEPGKLADLIVVDGDPTENVSILRDLSNLRFVMQDGEMRKNTCEE
ncbi:MAG: amidohydrolase family protein [Myxococcota bacterium]